MPLIALDNLDAHPDNANRMPADLLAKLAMHIRTTGDYPPLIVRRHPSQNDRFQILDGHHRAIVLRELGQSKAKCEIWNVDDERASMLLLTLNRLHGEDDPQQRGKLLASLKQSLGIEALRQLLPDDANRIQKLIDLTLPIPSPAPPPARERMPHAVTFFLNEAQRSRLLERLDAISCDRSAALIELLQLDIAQ